jgi:hypothetical protein
LKKRKGLMMCGVGCQARCSLTRDVPPHDGLERYDPGLLHEDGAAIELLAVLAHLLGHLLYARSDDVVRNDGSQLVEPEERELREDATFVRDALVTRGVIVNIREDKGEMIMAMYLHLSEWRRRRICDRMRRTGDAPARTSRRCRGPCPWRAT